MANVDVTFLGTGAGNCIYRSHTAIVLDCSDGTRLLLDGSSGNSILSRGAALGIMGAHFDQVLLTHEHADHMGGLPFLQAQRTLVDPAGPPLRVYSTEGTLNALRELCRATRMRAISVDQEEARSHDGHQVFQWLPTGVGDWVDLGATTRASSFPVDHIPGAVGWKVESDGTSVVFSDDTRFSESLIEAAKGARLLIHEAMNTASQLEDANRRGHSTAADAGRAAALAGVGELIITHIDSPYHFDTKPLLDEARKFFDGPVSVAHDMHQVTVVAG